MKPLTTSVYTFSDLIAGGYLYVDKTAQIHELIRGYKGQYFLARPRRFGKSLLVSTLKAIFQGRRELFDGLAIAKTDHDWKPYPVIHLDLGAAAAQTPDQLEEALCYGVNANAKTLGVALTRNRAAGRLQELIEGLAERDGKVVILIDEYDKPILGHLGSPSVKEIQRALKEFYGVIKTTEAAQRFVLVTGVSKFSKVSIFSDLNNLTDLTMRRDATTLLGYTQDELEANFTGYIEALAAELGKSREAALAEMRDWYNGYRFEESAETVYNPVSVMKCFQELKFKNYWFETGTPSFLIELLRRQPLELGNLSAPETAFSAYNPGDLAALPLLVQTGYLTIKGADELLGTRYYHLGYPNREIEQSFSYWLARDLGHVPDVELGGALRAIHFALNEGRIGDMLEHLKTFFHGIPNTITLKHEKYYQSLFFAVFKLIGAAIAAEVATSVGRIDAVVRTKTDIFIFEFKLHGTAEEALRQIREKQYAAPYRDDPRKVTLVGAAFDPAERNLGRWLIEPA